MQINDGDVANKDIFIDVEIGKVLSLSKKEGFYAARNVTKFASSLS